MGLLNKHIGIFTQYSNTNDIGRSIIEHHLNVIQLYTGKIETKTTEVRKKGGSKNRTRKTTRDGSHPKSQVSEVVSQPSNGKKGHRRMAYVHRLHDLNTSCPKDNYPLSSINNLINQSSGCELLSFKDAYSGHNQIHMREEDEEKPAFIIEQRTFCFRMMSFGLKNMGATFQRMMDQIFKEQMHTRKF